MDHEKYMRMALELAAQAEGDGDVPVGCVIVKEDRGHRPGPQPPGGAGGRHRPCGGGGHPGCLCPHRELAADGLHPVCHPAARPMCAGAIINARIRTLRYGTRDDKAGCCGSVLNLFEERFNHHPRIYQGPLREECESQLQDFFRGLREKSGET